MLISDSFIFIAIPKTGTHSIRSLLREHSTDEHVGTGGGVCKPHKSKFSNFAKISHGHLTCEQIKDAIPKEDWIKLFKFAVVRNPYSRAVSLYSFCNRNIIEKPDIITFYKNIKNRSVLFKPQSYFLVDSENKLMTDYLIRYEHYQEDINKVFDKLGLPQKELPVINKSNHDDYKEYYIKYPELKSIIEEYYSMDFEVLDYEKSLD